MYLRAVAGLVAGLCAGVVTGIMFLIMSVPDVDGSIVPLLTVVSRAVGYNDPAVGWSFHLFNSAVIGALFGVIVGRYALTLMRSAVLGLSTGFVLWIVEGLVVLPTLVGQRVLAPLTTITLHPVMVGTLIGSVIFGILMGVMFLLLYRPIYYEEFPPSDTGESEVSEREPVASSRR